MFNSLFLLVVSFFSDFSVFLLPQSRVIFSIKHGLDHSSGDICIYVEIEGQRICVIYRIWFLLPLSDLRNIIHKNFGLGFGFFNFHAEPPDPEDTKYISQNLYRERNVFHFQIQLIYRNLFWFFFLFFFLRMKLKKDKKKFISIFGLSFFCLGTKNSFFHIFF